MNRKNFELLAAHLENLVPPPEFSMYRFTTLSHSADLTYLATGQLPECGTVACAAGHGPVAGILDPGAQDWNDYVERNFLETDEFNSLEFSPVYRWCFSCGWTHIDNTPEGAAKRIRYMLDKGIPSGFGDPDVKWVEVYNA